VKAMLRLLVYPLTSGVATVRLARSLRGRGADMGSSNKCELGANGASLLFGVSCSHCLDLYIITCIVVTCLSVNISPSLLFA
jgi:hypothetical protein